MAGDKLSAKEAALIAQAREQFGLPPAAGAKAQSAAQAARVERSLPPAAVERVTPDPSKALAPEGATPGPALEPAERIAALMAAARAESERRRKLYVWGPVAFASVLCLSALAFMWILL